MMRGWVGVEAQSPILAAKSLDGKGIGSILEQIRSAQSLKCLMSMGWGLKCRIGLPIAKLCECYNLASSRNCTLKTAYSRAFRSPPFQNHQIPHRD